VPLHQRHVERGGHFFGQHGFAGARFTFDQQRTLQGEGGVDRQFEVGGGDVLVGTFKAGSGLHAWVSGCGRWGQV